MGTFTTTGSGQISGIRRRGPSTIETQLDCSEQVFEAVVMLIGDH